MPPLFFFFFFNDTAPTEIYTLSLHTLFRSSQSLEIASEHAGTGRRLGWPVEPWVSHRDLPIACGGRGTRSEEHTSELQSRLHLVCRLLLEKKKNITNILTSACQIRS